jgi:hypothetical protein
MAASQAGSADWARIEANEACRPRMAATRNGFWERSFFRVFFTAKV